MAQEDRYRVNRAGQSERHVTTMRGQLLEAFSTDGSPGREREVVLRLRRTVGRVTDDMSLSFTHRRALSLVKILATCLAAEGASKTAVGAADVLDNVPVKFERGSSRPKPRPTPAPQQERLLDSLAFVNPEAEVDKLSPAEALRLLEEVEPALGEFVIRRMKDVVRPMLDTETRREVVLNAQAEVVRLVVTALLTQRQSYRRLMDDLLPREAS